MLTGGACQLAGVRELAARMLGRRQVRLGRPSGLRGLPDSASGPAFATAAGLLAWAAGEGRAMHDIDLEAERPTGLFRRLVDFLKERVVMRAREKFPGEKSLARIAANTSRNQLSGGECPDDPEPDRSRNRRTPISRPASP